VGTRFQASWDDERGHLTVKLYEGAVEVLGGPMHQPVLLRTGQQLEVDAKTQAARITALQAHASAPDVPRTPAAQATPEPVLRSAAPAPHVPSWSTLMTRSDFATIVEQARARGIARCLGSCTPKDLRILADAARYVGDAALAEASLLALRRRSPAQAHAAGFFLGRLYESQGRSSEALAMYEQHLAEAPGGDYAEQAAAGRMRMLLRLERHGPAREAARRYLALFPEGVHAAFARRLLEGEAAP
jgi:tetratricopeptide (TPR) repeat protein